MKGEYRRLLDANMAALCEGMDHAKVVSRLAKSGLFGKFELEKISHKDTTQDKNMQVVEYLQDRDFGGLSEFLRTLASIDHAHYKLAEKLQPVEHRIAWFAPSPAHAASVVYALEEYAGAKFSRMERGGANKSLVIRRARIFPREFDREQQPRTEVPLDSEKMVTFSHKTEVCLIFPASHVPSDILPALESFFAADELISNVDMFLTGVTDVVGRGRVVLATEVCNVVGGERVSAGVKEDKLKSLETCLKSLEQGTEEWIKKEQDGVALKLDVSFNTLCQLTKGSEETLDAATSVIFISDPMAYRFYELCQARCPEKGSLLCHSALCQEEEGELAVVGLGVETRAAVTSSCVLMEVCRHLYDDS